MLSNNVGRSSTMNIHLLTTENYWWLWQEQFRWYDNENYSKQVEVWVEVEDVEVSNVKSFKTDYEAAKMTQ